LGKSTNNPRHGGRNDAGDQGYEEKGLSMKHAREQEDFDVQVRKGDKDDVVVIFKPTGRRYIFLFFPSGLLDVNSVNVTGDVGDYLPSEVDELARRRAYAAARASP
jgi:hypothetical protein